MSTRALALLLSLAFVAEAHAEPAAFELKWPTVRLWVGAEKVEGVEIRAVDAEGRTVPYSGRVEIEGLSVRTASLADGVAKLDALRVEAEVVSVRAERLTSRIEVPTLAGIWSLAPAFLAILLALITRQVLLSLFGGVWLGAALLYMSPIAAVPRAFDILARVAADGDRVKIMVFTLLMGGMVGVISASGGTTGIVQVVVRYAKGAKSASVATWLMGMLVFFDDYASSLLVGSTMRPVTDRFRVSREKLSFLVDSTAAPIASLAIVSTWVGYEVSVLGDALSAAGIERDAYDVFLSGIPSRFYQFFALAFVLMVALMNRDFGPMLHAERRARREGKPIRDGAEPLMDAGLLDEAEALGKVPPRWWLAIVPIATLVGTVLVHLWTTGTEAGLADPSGYLAAKEAGAMRHLGYVLSNAASYDALLYGSAFSAIAAMVLAGAVRALDLGGSFSAFTRGVRAMTLALLVLVLAWSIGKVMDDLRAGPYVASAIAATLPAWSLPALTFVLASLIALATGTSWGTMAILMPIAIPVVGAHSGLPEFEALLLGTASAILGGSVFGDHCSPISDTTVLSSIASASDHVDHTRTQAPYAVVSGLVALALGYLPLGFGLSPWISLVLGLAALFGVLRVFGQSPD